MKRLTSTLVLLLLATLAPAHPVTYKLDPEHTQVLVGWEHFGFSHPSANFGQASGILIYDSENLAASSVKVTLPLAGLNSFVPALDEHLRGPEFFDAKTYPDITFKSTKVDKAGDGKLKVTGDLTIKGITKPAVLDVTLNKAAVQPMTHQLSIGFDAATTLKRSDFGVDMYAPMVSDEVTVRITTEGSVPEPALVK